MNANANATYDLIGLLLLLSAAAVFFVADLLQTFREVRAMRAARKMWQDENKKIILRQAKNEGDKK